LFNLFLGCNEHAAWKKIMEGFKEKIIQCMLILLLFDCVNVSDVKTVVVLHVIMCTSEELFYCSYSQQDPK